ncbi:hypothetical protein RF55_13603 [Lasius niger]|uniref:Uncharacterized protein n=1 Tax=Lasius niger TaxID=67767 RepID=A0A0J7KA83_LASNI|nr:hypothetical protein RF55_13603 [Lasius niger]
MLVIYRTCPFKVDRPQRLTTSMAIAIARLIGGNGNGGDSGGGDDGGDGGDRVVVVPHSSERENLIE